MVMRLVIERSNEYEHLQYLRPGLQKHSDLIIPISPAILLSDALGMRHLSTCAAEMPIVGFCSYRRITPDLFTWSPYALEKRL